MVNRKRPIILRCPVTAEERNLIEQKMAQLQTKRIGAYLHMPPQKCNLTADDGAWPPLEWCTASAEMVHGGRGRGAAGRHAGNYSGMPLRLRMDSPSIWMV